MAIDTNQVFWKWAIHDAMIKSLYKIPGEVLKANFCKLVKSVGNNDPEIIAKRAEVFLYFRGKRYYSRQAGFHELAFDSNLRYEQAYPNEEQTIQLEETLQHIEELDNEKRVIENYLAKIFNKAESVEDIKLLLPTAAHKYIEVEDGNPRVTLSDDQISQIRADTIKFAHLLNERILINLVTKED